jgi:hypothetical protein
MRGKRKTSGRRPKKETLTDLEVAKKMIKIFQSAADRKLEFDLSFNTVKKLLLEPKCYYTGKKFEENGVYARSFDRVDSDLGYVEGNVVACTVDINSKKSNLTFEEIETLYKVLSENQAKPVKEEVVNEKEGEQEISKREDEVKT